MIYGCVEITADAGENIVPLIFKEMTGNIPTGNKQFLKYIAFEGTADTAFKINGVPNIVPSTGKFFTPYGENSNFIIRKFSFDSGCSGLKIWFIN